MVYRAPLMDMVAVMVRRIRKGSSPFKPDREHLHHILMRGGLTPRQTLMVIVSAAILFAVIGIISEHNGVTESMMLSAFLAASVGYFWLITRVWRVLAWVRRINHGRSAVAGSTEQHR